MVRLSDLPDIEAQHLLAKNGEPLGPAPWVACGDDLSSRVFALITTAGIHPAGATPFESNDATYRVLPGGSNGADFAMSHASVNFDRTGFQDDVNIVYPIDRLKEMAANGEIGSVADFHYSFMGATDTDAMEPSARELAGMLKEDGVTAVLLSPV